MSFYYDEPEPTPTQTQTQSSTTDTPTATEICPNCGSSSFYHNDTTGILTCNNCYTTSQTQKLNKADLAEDNELSQTLYGIQANVRKNIKGSRQVEDKSVPLPELDVFVEAYTIIMKHLARKIVALCLGPEKKPEFLRLLKSIWMGYVTNWSDGVDWLHVTHGLTWVRCSFRDAFLHHTRAKTLVEYLERRVQKTTTSEEMGEERTTKRRSRKVKEMLSSGDDKSQGSRFPSSSSQSSSSSPATEDDDSVSTTSTTSTVRWNKHKRQVPYHKRHSKLVDALNKLRLGVAVSPYEAALRIRPTLPLILSMLHLTLLHFRSGVSAAHILNYILSGDLPFANAFSLLPSRLRQKLHRFRRVFDGRLTCVHPRRIELESELMGMAAGWRWRPGMVVGVVDNAPLMMSRFVSDLGLGRRVLRVAWRLMGVALTTEEEEEEETLVTPPLKNAHCAILTSPHHVLAVLIVAIKCMPRWEEWQLRFQKRCRKLIPWNEDQLRRMMTKGGLRFVEGYLDYLGETFFDETAAHKNFKTFVTSLEEQSARTRRRKRRRQWRDDDEETEDNNGNGGSTDDDDDDNDDDDAWYCLAGYPNPNQPPNDNKSTPPSSSTPHRYLSYLRSNDKKEKQYPSPLPYHPQYGLLVEFIATTFHSDPHVLHGLVQRLDEEMVKLGLDAAHYNENEENKIHKNRFEMEKRQYKNWRQKSFRWEKKRRRGGGGDDDDDDDVSDDGGVKRKRRRACEDDDDVSDIDDDDDGDGESRRSNRTGRSSMTGWSSSRTRRSRKEEGKEDDSRGTTTVTTKVMEGGKSGG